MKLLISFLFLSSFVLYDVYSQEVDSYVDTKMKMVCYFHNKAVKRVGDGKFLPEMIDTNLCTHIIYAFAHLDDETLVMKTSDRVIDIDMKMYERVTDLKKLGKKVMISLGGWKDSLGDKYGKLLTDVIVRKNFIINAIEFIERFNFDGLDLFLEYPVCWHKNCDTNRLIEKDGFVLLVKDLYTELKKRGLLLSIVVAHDKKIIDMAYDINVLTNYVDWITVKTFDYHTYFDGRTGLIAPLITSDGLNVDVTIKHLIKVGVNTKKLIVGIPTYGRTFTLKDEENHGLYDVTIGAGEEGMFTKKRGLLGFYEICLRTQRDGFNVVRDTLKKGVSFYAFRNNQWVTFDGVDTVRTKAHYIKEMNLGGAMVTFLDLDDFKGKCGCGRYPLLMTLNYILRGIGTHVEKCV